MVKTVKQLLGAEAENHALLFLKQQGLSLLERNYSCKQGEIDLIMRDKNNVVFVEVRYRDNPDHGDPLESITRSKQAKVIKAATMYLLKNSLYDKVACRFDVATLSSMSSKVHWIKDAFQVQ